MPYRRDFQRAGADTLAALQAVGMEVARLLASAVVGRELHGADAGAVLALRFAGRRHMDVGEGTGQGLAAGRYPRGNRAHRAERAPRARRVDEREGHAHDGGHHDDGPKDAAYAVPHSQSALAPGHALGQLHAEHAEDEQHHEQPEAERAHETGYLAVGRVFGEQAVVHIAARTDVAAPPATLPY